MPIDLSAVQWDDPSAIDPSKVKWDSAAQRVGNDAISQGARNFAADGSDALGGVSQAVLNGLGGFVRGAGSIGATLARPFETAAENEQRRAGIDRNMQAIGAQPDSRFYKGGKLGGEVAGTAGAGGVLAKPIQALASTRYASGIEPLLEGVATGLKTGGFRVGDLAGTGMGTLARLGTGGAVGGAAAGLVNPEDAGTGALIGAALPGATQLAGKTGEPIGNVLRKGQAPNNVMLDTARRSMDAGYIIPPSMVDPTFRNRLLESMSGKFETAQLASTKNQSVTDALTRRALGLPADAPLTQETMGTIRANAGKVYEQAKGAGTITADPAYFQALDDIAAKYKTAAKDFPNLGPTNMHGKPIDVIGDMVDGLKVKQFDASSAIDGIAVLRDTADKAFMAGDKTLGKAAKDAAKAMESVVERHLDASGQPELFDAFKNARQQIAKSYTVQKALREGAGTVDARVLGRDVQNAKPLSDELLQIGQFGNTFNKAAQPPNVIGSPAVNTLKNTLAMVTSGIGGYTMGPAGVALGALNYAIPPVARSAMFSRPFQRGLLGASAPLLDEATPMGLLSQSAYRVGPLLSAQ